VARRVAHFATCAVSGVVIAGGGSGLIRVPKLLVIIENAVSTFERLW
jgi:hypothetical protein